LRKVESELAIKQKTLKDIQDKVASLQRNYENTLRKSESLKQQQETAAIQLVRAEKLVGGLAGEAERWKVNVGKLEEDLKSLVGNIVLASASIAYIGPFTNEYRSMMVRDWAQKCRDSEIPVSSDYQLSRILA
jgi:dynein heavy chain